MANTTTTRRRALRALLACIMVSMVVAGTQNKEVTRVIDTTTNVVRVFTTIQATGVEDAYMLAFPKSLASHLSWLRIKDGNKKVAYERGGEQGDLILYKVKTGNGDFTLSVTAVFTDVLTPYPTEIAQNENQLVLYEDSHYVPSIYPTLTQTTTVKLASPAVEMYTKLSPSSVSGNTLTLGPYKDIQGGAASFSPLTIHSENNYPFASFNVAVREIEVSHWGNVAFEDYYEVQHNGAVLKGGFSRFDYMTKRNSGSSSFRVLYAALPRLATGIYYRDQIGNISSSTVRSADQGVDLTIETRFPLFGGWKTTFYIGYNIPIQALVTRSGDKYTLRVPFGAPFPDVWTRDLTVKIILPEWAHDIKANVKFSTQESRTSRYTYLDTTFSGGRPVITLRKANTVAEHNAEMIITYHFNQAAMILEPLYLVAGFLAFYLVSMIFFRVDLRLRDEVPATKSKTA